MFTQVSALREARSVWRDGSLNVMTVKFSRIAMASGALMVVAGVLTACGDSSTASAPITEGVTTTTMLSSSGKDKADDTKGDDASSSEANDAASKATSTLPATGPNKSTKVPGNFPGSNGGQVQLNDKDKKYLASLKTQKIAFMGDEDGNIALTMGHYVCQEQARKTDPTMIKAYVRAAIGPITKSEDEASGKADKIIATADKELC